jgi:hypothetical protein
LVVSIIRFHVSGLLYFFFLKFCCNLKTPYVFGSPEVLATFAKFQCLLSNLFLRNAHQISSSPVMHEPVIFQLLTYLPLFHCILYTVTQAHISLAEIYRTLQSLLVKML